MAQHHARGAERVTMRLWIFSDLHVDRDPIELASVEADAVVIAGDVCSGPDALDWLQARFPKLPVVYVLGNHEYYGHTMPSLRRDFEKRAQGSNIHVLENRRVEVGDLVFLGCTLWTDFELYGRPVDPMREAARRMNDFRLIRYFTDGDGERYAATLEPLDTHSSSTKSLFCGYGKNLRNLTAEKGSSSSPTTVRAADRWPSATREVL